MLLPAFLFLGAHVTLKLLSQLLLFANCFELKYIFPVMVTTTASWKEFGSQLPSGGNRESILSTLLPNSWSFFLIIEQ